MNWSDAVREIYSSVVTINDKTCTDKDGNETGEIEWHCANQNRVYSEEITAFSIRQMGDTGGALCISDNRSPYYEMPENFRFMLDDF